ncbi:MAG: hypothetical protein ACI8QF_004599, partial [Limisphaerales bacterium]
MLKGCQRRAAFRIDAQSSAGMARKRMSGWHPLGDLQSDLGLGNNDMQ